VKIIHCLILFLLTHFSVLHSQKKDFGSWNILNVKYQINEKWSLSGESQLRSLQFYNHFHYYEYKAFVNHSINKNVKLTLGAGSYQTYKEGGNFVLPKNNNEFRLWPQLTLLQSIGKLKIEQRYRFESRLSTKGYRNRYRYRIGVFYPFGLEKNKYKPFQLSVSNELFFTDSEPYFERNRLLFTFNYKPSKSSTIQVGYLHQFDYKINDETGKDFFVLGLYYEIFRKYSPETEVENVIKDN
jgi:hypothetical protein